ncbi:DNA-processing protein DprA [Streptomyces sp. NPDC002668]|uniref:DNA-processing protein DprA n=1 Tax=Streptomyces sp. NPDC002668 TaxID=3154422 RepID=UPI00332FC29B
MTTYDTELIMRAVAITGTRSTGHRGLDEYATLFADYLAPFADRARFYIGGARGIDSLSLLWLARRTTAALTVVTPGTLDQQPPDARQAVTRVSDRVDLIELGAAELRAPAYHARNRFMVDHSSMTIGFPHAAEPESGTWQTLNYTADQGKPRLIVPV